MKIIRQVNSLQTLVIDDDDYIEDHSKRYYAIPKDYRPDVPSSPWENDPADIPYIFRYGDKYKREQLAFLCNMAHRLYWDIIASEAEQTYKENK